MNRRLQNDERGLVSIVVTIFVMLILSLIVLGFAQLMRREQRQALDRQLSTQAFYAAEAGVNEAVKAIRGGSTDGKDKKQCNANEEGWTGINPELDAAAGIMFTCLLVDQSPTTLEFDTIATDQSTVIPIFADQVIRQLNLSWEDKEGGDTFNCGRTDDFPSFNDWQCTTGMLRIDLVPLPPTFTRDNLLSSTFTAFLFPQEGNASGSTAGIGDATNFQNQGRIIGVSCNDEARPKKCNLKVSGLTESKYVLRLRGIYRSSSLSVSARNPDNNPLELRGAQAVVDSTGKANDVLRRIQVRVKTSPFNNDLLPDYALQSADTLCKRFTVWPGGAQPEADDPTCQLN